MDNSTEFRLDKTVLTFASSYEEAAEQDKESWRQKMPEERLAALEVMRQVLYGYDPTPTRLQRVLEVVKNPRS